MRRSSIRKSDEIGNGFRTNIDKYNELKFKVCCICHWLKAKGQGPRNISLWIRSCCNQLCQHSRQFCATKFQFLKFSNIQIANLLCYDRLCQYLRTRTFGNVEMFYRLLICAKLISFSNITWYSYCSVSYLITQTIIL